MNDKARALYDIVGIVVDCCATEIDDEGRMSVTAEDVCGPSRAENVLMTRCICVQMLIGVGFSVTTVAQLLKRTPHAVRHLLEVGRSYLETSWAYRVAYSEATIRIRDAKSKQ